MVNYCKKEVAAYIEQLVSEEKSRSTREQYERNIRRFLDFAEGKELTKELVVTYKAVLQNRYRPSTVNVILAALNGFFGYLDRGDLKVKQLKIQRAVYCSERKELSRGEYLRLVQTADRQGDDRIAAILQTICSTGIRVSELKYITAEAIRQGEAVIRLKGKVRVILIPGKLRKLLRTYMKRHRICNGSVFVSRKGNPLDRSNIWKMMKSLCKNAGVMSEKVYPHNLRHLFARAFYKKEKDIAKLADILGHSSINTTRIYIVSTGTEHRRYMDALGLVQ